MRGISGFSKKNQPDGRIEEMPKGFEMDRSLPAQLSEMPRLRLRPSLAGTDKGGARWLDSHESVNQCETLRMDQQQEEFEAPVLDQVNLVVRNMEATVAFYRLLGLQIPDAEIWRDGDGAHASVKFPNGVDLEFDSPAFAAAYNAGWSEDGAGSGRVVLTFRTATRDGVDTMFERVVAAGNTPSQPPYDAFWGARYAVVLDPDGHPVGLMSESDPARRSPPPKMGGS